MKSLLFLAIRITSVRIIVILLSLAQASLWAAALGIEMFGVVSTYISAQAFASLLGRLGADNLLVRQYESNPTFRARFPAYLAGVIAGSLAFGAMAVVLVTIVIFREWQGIDVYVFLALVITFNLSLVLSKILVAQKHLTLASILGNGMPLLVSIGLFAIALPWLDELSNSGHIIAIGALAIGYFLSALSMVVPLRGFLVDCVMQTRGQSQRSLIVLGREHWYFLGYQSIGMVRVQGTILALAAIFGSTEAGLFALANRFGNLLSHLNETARMYVMPRVSGKTWEQIGVMYRTMLGLNSALGVAGIAFLVGIYSFVSLPFPTDPPFPLYAAIIMVGAAFNLFVGPTGAILAMSGNERNNFSANLSGLLVIIVSLAVGAVVDRPLIVIIGVAASSILTNLMNTISLLTFFRRARGRASV